MEQQDKDRGTNQEITYHNSRTMTAPVTISTPRFLTLIYITQPGRLLELSMFGIMSLDDIHTQTTSNHSNNVEATIECKVNYFVFCCSLVLIVLLFPLSSGMFIFTKILTNYFVQFS